MSNDVEHQSPDTALDGSVAQEVPEVTAQAAAEAQAAADAQAPAEAEAAAQTAADTEAAEHAATAQAADEAEDATQAAAKAEAPAEREPSAQDAQAEHGDLDLTAGKEPLLHAAAPAIDKTTATGASVKDRVGDVSAYTVVNGKWVLDTGKKVLSDVASYAVDNAPGAWAVVKDRCESAYKSTKENGMWAWDNAYSFAVKHVPPVWAAAKDYGAENASLYKGAVAAAVVGAAVLPVAAPVVGAVAAATAVGSLYVTDGDNMAADGLRWVGDQVDARQAIQWAPYIYGASLIKGAHAGKKNYNELFAKVSKERPAVTLTGSDQASNSKVVEVIVETLSKVAQSYMDSPSYSVEIMKGIVDAICAVPKDTAVAAFTTVGAGLALPALHDYGWGKSGHQDDAGETFAAPPATVVGSTAPELVEAL